MNEVHKKTQSLRKWMACAGYDTVILSTNENFSWITGGKTAYVDKSGPAASKIMITGEKNYVICNSSERYRITEEELMDDTFALLSYRWHEDEATVLEPFIKGKRVASDNGCYGENRGSEIQKLRYILTEEEIIRYRKIGPECAGILEEACRMIQPGETELEVAGRIDGMLIAKGYNVPVCMVAADDRISKYRHPLPKSNPIQKYALAAICAQKYGLTISITRMISFGEPDADKKKRMEAVLRVDAAYILSTIPGVLAVDVLKAGQRVYASTGYGEDFHLHHQGGAIGYPTRDYCTNFSTTEMVHESQAFSWNPTIAGVKSEDTFIVINGTPEIITHTGTWPYIPVEYNGIQILRPSILIK